MASAENSEVIFDENGVATIKVNPLLPGIVDMKLQVENTLIMSGTQISIGLDDIKDSKPDSPDPSETPTPTASPSVTPTGIQL